MAPAGVRRLLAETLRSPGRLLWLAASLAALFLSLPVLGVITQAPGSIQYRDEEFKGGSQAVPGALEVVSGFSPGVWGLDLVPGVSGELTYTIVKAPGDDLAVNLWLNSDARLTNALSVSLDGGPAQPLGHNLSLNGALLDLPAGTRQASQVQLDLVAGNQGAEEVLVLGRMTYGIVPPGPPQAGPAYASWALGALAGLLAIPLMRRRWARLGVAVAIALIVGAATEIRIPALVYAVHSVPPNPDTMAYQIWGDQFQWWPLNQGLFCGCWGPREPVWVAAAHLLTQLFGSSSFHLRAATTLISIGDVALAIAAARRRLSWPGALSVGLLLALNGNAASNATRGLRTELEMTLCLGLYMLLDRDAAKRPLAEAGFSGLLGAALALTRTFFLPVVLAAQAISLLSRYRPVRRALLLLGVAAILPLAGTAGHRLALYELPYVEYGLSHDAFLDTDSYARWLANVEKFEVGAKLPHPELFPTLAEVQTCGPYCGPHLTYFQYLFVLHTPQQVLIYSLDGYGDVLRNTGGFLRVDPSYLTGDESVIIPPLYGPIGDWVDQAVRDLGVLGLLLMTITGPWRPRNLLVPVMFVGVLGFAVFLYHLHLIELYYNVVQAWPFLFIGAGWVVEGGVRLALDAGLWRRSLEFLASRRWPSPRRLLPAVGALPFAIGAALAGVGVSGWHPHRPGLEVAVIIMAVTASMVMVAGSPELSSRLQRSRVQLAILLLAILAVPLLSGTLRFDTGSWTATLRLALAHPLFGVGWGGLNATHDQYLQTAAEGGLVGLVGLLWTLVAAAWSARLTTGPTRALLWASLGILALAMVVHSVLTTTAGLVATLAIVGLSCGLPILAPHAAPKRP